MVLKPDPIFAAVEHVLGIPPVTAESLKEDNSVVEAEAQVKPRIILMCPQGRRIIRK